jgi:hypothetical protein
MRWRDMAATRCNLCPAPAIMGEGSNDHAHFPPVYLVAISIVALASVIA